MLRPSYLLLLVACSLAASCRGSGDGAERVSLRLRAADFAQPTAGHAPMLAIGNTAREVVALPRRNKIGRVEGALFADGVARLDVATAPLPAGAALELEVHALSIPNLLDQRDRDLIAIGGRFVRLEQGWQLERPAAGPARLTIARDAVRDAVPEEQTSAQVLTRLVARGPIPAELSSRPFENRPRSTIELAYGVLGAPALAEPPPPVEMRATLRCGARSHVLLRATVAPGRDPPGWHAERTELPHASTPCTLELAQSDAAGEPSAFVVWGAPLVRTADQATDLRIVLISLDTLRADHVSGYGYPRRTTPEIDRRLIASGVRFDDAMTTISSTGVAHLSLFTGLFPRQQRTAGRLGAQDPTPTLAERLQQAGFTTAAFTEDGLIAGPFGFWFGFDQFREYPVVSGERGTRVFRDGISFLRNHRGGRFFLFLHTYKVHDPWVFGDDTRGRFRDDARWSDGTLDARIPGQHRDSVDAYDRTIVEADGMVAGFLDELDRLGLAEHTLVVLLSDHGEAFGEHGLVGHGIGYQQEQLHIPLVFRGPGVAAGETRQSSVGITDVASTILDLAGVDGAGFGSGQSLAAQVRPGASADPAALPPRPLYFTWLLTREDGVRMGAKKLVTEGARCREYDLRDDPLEERPTIVACNESQLAGLIDRYRVAAKSGAGGGPETEPPATAEATAPTDPVSVSPEVESTLRALGYVR